MASGVYKRKDRPRTKRPWIVWWRDEAGKIRRQSFADRYGPGSADEFLTEITKHVQDIRHGLRPRIKEIGFTALVVLWLERTTHRVRDSTLETYEDALQHHLTPYFGNRVVTSITRDDVEAYMSHAAKASVAASKPRTDAENGKTKPRLLSATTVNYHLAVLKMVLEDGRRWGYLYANPAADVRKYHPKPESGETGDRDVDPLTREEIRRLFDAARGDPSLIRYYPLFVTGLYTGMRRGELLGLRWSDVDFERDKIHVRRSLRRARRSDGTRELRLMPPKSTYSRRAIDMEPEVAAALQQVATRFAGAKEPEAVFVFSAVDAQGHLAPTQPLDPDNLLKRVWTRALRKAKIPYRKFHNLRHTYAALQIAAQAHPKYIQAQMGHHSITVTMNTYGHLMASAFESRRGKLGAVLDSPILPPLARLANESGVGEITKPRVIPMQEAGRAART